MSSLGGSAKGSAEKFWFRVEKKDGRMIPARPFITKHELCQ